MKKLLSLPSPACLQAGLLYAAANRFKTVTKRHVSVIGRTNISGRLISRFATSTIFLLLVFFMQKSQAQTDGRIVPNSDHYSENMSNVLRATTKGPVCAAPAGKANITTSAAMDALRDAIRKKLNKKEKVTLDLFVMSQCPFGVMAEQSIIPAIKEFGNSIELRLNFIAQQSTISGKSVISSLHGQPEVDENIRQLIIARDYPSKLSSYLLYRAENFNTSDWQVAARKAGIKTDALSEALQRPESKELLKVNMQKAQELQIASSPKLLINGTPYNAQLIGPDPSAASATACQSGTDPFTGKNWVVCTATDTYAWIAATSPGGGQYHSLYICNSLGYANVGRIGGTCGAVCGYCNFNYSCSNPQPNTTFDGGGTCGSDTHGPILCNTVMWECTGTLQPSFSTCPTDITAPTDANACSAVVTYTAEASGNPTYSYVFTGATTGSGSGTGSGQTFNTGTTTVTITATNHNLSATCSFNVTVEDKTAPVVNCPTNITQANTAGTCGRVVTYNAPTATDNCSPSTGAIWTLSNVSFADGGVATGSFVYDASNNTVSNWNISVSGGNTGTFPALVYTPANSTVFPVSGGKRILFTSNSSTRMLRLSTDGARTNAGGSVTIDFANDQNFNVECYNCSPFRYVTGGSMTGVPGITITQIGGLPSGSTFPVGVTTNKFRATDAAGNSTDCSFTVTVEDKEAPVLKNGNTTPSSLNQSGLNECLSTAQNFSAASLQNSLAVLYKDNCTGVSALYKSTAAGSNNTNCSWSFTYMYTISDDNGNNFDVTITRSGSDQTAPALKNPNVGPASLNQTGVNACLQAAQQFDATSLQGALAALYSDNCSTVTATLKGQPQAGVNNSNCAWTFTYTYTISDGCASNSFDVNITRSGSDQTPPTAKAKNITIALDNTGKATLTASMIDDGSSDNCTSLTSANLSIDKSNFTCANTGPNTVILTVTDGCSNKSTAQATVTVVDNQPPVINTITSPLVLLWPPNHKYQTVTASQFVSSVTDNCGSVSAANVLITKVTSDEPDDLPGDADGNTTQDIKIAPDCKSVDLRSERIETGNGRVYTLYLKVSDSKGNTATATAQAIVPVNQSGKTAVDNGPVYTVLSNCNSASITRNITAPKNLLQEVQKLQMNARPNPTTNQFTVQLAGVMDKGINLRVFDVLGRTVEARQGLAAGTTLQIGATYRPGVYIVEAIQGNERVKMKLIKQPH